MAAIPQELMEDILVRLPMKSLLRFKTASKKWYSLIIENKEFAYLNLKQPLSSSKHFILYRIITLNGDIFHYSDVDSHESCTINFPIEIGDIFRYSYVDSHESCTINFPIGIGPMAYCRLVGSVNGLICVALPDGSDFCCIWNPYTGEYKRICIPIRVDRRCLIGFGYDSISDDYKILGVWHLYLHIFSLKTNSWKRLEYSFEHESVIRSVHSNGALYWCIGSKITAFDLAKEEITFLDLSEEGIDFDNGYNSPPVPLLDYEGSLCIYDYTSIWKMKECNNSKSWAKLIPSLPYDHNAKPVSISRLGEAVFVTKSGLGPVPSVIQRRRWDNDFSKGRTWLDVLNRLKNDEFFETVGDAFVYTESLVSPKFFS